MIFSFDAYEQPNLQIWSELNKVLPEDYRAPDSRFLQSLEPTMRGEPFIESKSTLMPNHWAGNMVFWSSAAANLPPSYSIPDLTLLKRMLEVR